MNNDFFQNIYLHNDTSQGECQDIGDGQQP
jgi:hypothetical protein